MFVNYSNTFKHPEVSREGRRPRSPVRTLLRPELSASPPRTQNTSPSSDKKRKFTAFAQDTDSDLYYRDGFDQSGRNTFILKTGPSKRVPPTVGRKREPPKPGFIRRTISSIYHFSTFPVRAIHSFIFEGLVSAVRSPFSPFKRRLIEVQPTAGTIAIKGPEPKSRSSKGSTTRTVTASDKTATSTKPTKSITTKPTKSTTTRPTAPTTAVTSLGPRTRSSTQVSATSRTKGKKAASEKQRKLTEITADTEPLQPPDPYAHTFKAPVFPPPIRLAPSGRVSFFYPSINPPSPKDSNSPPPAGKEERMETFTTVAVANDEVADSLPSPPTSPTPVRAATATTAVKAPAEDRKNETAQTNGDLPPVASLSLTDANEKPRTREKEREAPRPKRDGSAVRAAAGPDAHYPFFAKVEKIWEKKRQLFFAGGVPKLNHHVEFQKILTKTWFDQPAKSKSSKYNHILVALLKLSGSYPKQGISGSVFELSDARQKIRRGIYLLVTIPEYYQHACTKSFIQHVNKAYEVEQEAERERELLKSRSLPFRLSQGKSTFRSSALGIPLSAQPVIHPIQGREKIERDAFARKVVWLDELPPAPAVAEQVEVVEEEKAKEEVIPPPVKEEIEPAVISLDDSEDEEAAKGDESAATTPTSAADEYELRPFFRSPHKIILPLTEKWESTVAAALAVANPLAPVYESISRKDIGTLCPTSSFDARSGWLNDEVINEMLTHLKTALVGKHALSVGGGTKSTDTPPVHVFSSFWFTQVSKQGVQSVARWSKRAKIDSTRLWDVEHLFIPVNPGGHWMLLYISPRLRLVEHYDSMNGSPNRYLQIAREFLALHLGGDGDGPAATNGTDGSSPPPPVYDESEWTFRRGVSNQQNNCNDCGVFTVWNAIAIGMGLKPSETVAQELMPAARRLSVAVLLNGGFKGDFAI